MWIGTPSGIQFSLDPFRVDDIYLCDICHNLARIQRFCGALESSFSWSVAQHSLMVYGLLKYTPRIETDRHLERAALVHDFSEAYLSDIPGPVKAMLPEYQRLEDKLMRAIRERFDIAPLTPSEEEVLKKVDRLSCWMEAKLGGLRPELWGWTDVTVAVYHDIYSTAWDYMRTQAMGYKNLPDQVTDKLYRTCRECGVEN